MDNQNNEEKKAHIFEIDFLRAVTVFSVVTIHTFSSTTFLYPKTEFATNLLNLFIHTLHYNRETFVFVTGLVLTYVYYHRQFSAVKFWSKRLLVIFIPYVLWTLLYVSINNTQKDFWFDLLTGGASYQLYYILLAMQYYLLFPLFLWIFKKISHHPITVLLISFVVQLLMLYFDFTYIQKGTFSHIPFIKKYILPYQDEFFISYQFFFILGAVVGVHLNKIYRFMQRYGYFSLPLFGLSLGCLALYFLHQLQIKDSVQHAMSVLQPSVSLYSTAVIIFFSWLSILWAKQKRFFSLIKAISDTSFGIFFVHVMILNYLITNFIPLTSNVFTPLETSICVAILTFVLSLLSCLILLRVRFLSWTIGRIGKRN